MDAEDRADPRRHARLGGGLPEKPPLNLEALLPFDEIVLPARVIEDLLQDFADERALRIARESMSALPIVEAPLRLPVVEEAANLFRLPRRAGLTIRSSVDCLIATCAIRHDLEVLHRDRDFEALARVSPLRLRGL